MGDLWIALDSQQDYATAERLAIEFGENFRLMADLGWNPKDDREAVELTMAPLDLMEVARRLCQDAQGGLAEMERERDLAAPPADIEGYERARDTCEEILEVLTDTYGGGRHAGA